MANFRRRALLMIAGSFPKEPSGYSLINTYTASGTFVADTDGWFQIEVFGASGTGGTGASKSNTGSTYSCGFGGGGGGGGYACSRVKLKKGDTVVLSPGSVGSTSSATINSSMESYSAINVTSGANGGAGTATSKYSATGGAGGAGGTASGGNYSNMNGYAGDDGESWDGDYSKDSDYSIPYGGDSAHSDGNTGGNGKYYYFETAFFDSTSYTYGKAGFIKIYRGNTNVV